MPQPQIVEFFAPPDQTLVLLLCEFGSTAPANGAGSVSTETARAGMYRAAVESDPPLAGWYTAHIVAAAAWELPIGDVWIDDSESLSRVRIAPIGPPRPEAITAEDVWAHAQRTLTSAAQLPEDETSAELITRRRGDSWSVSLAGLGNIEDAEEIWLTLKRQPNQLDSAAVLQVTSTGGLVIGLTAEPTDAAIAVDDATAGNVTITVEPAATKLVAPRTYEYDIQVRRTGGQIQTLAAGQWTVLPDVTRSV